ncbi:hypothetical protein SDC9_120034 [bioreactor metagenome]|uniref:Uncharacterized protein n=1 Tax=bioreactor metagenome TaxID=1076179 RepID=A0A645C6R0_9ZZZZ
MDKPAPGGRLGGVPLRLCHRWLLCDRPAGGNDLGAAGHGGEVFHGNTSHCFQQRRYRSYPSGSQRAHLAAGVAYRRANPVFFADKRGRCLACGGSGAGIYGGYFGPGLDALRGDQPNWDDLFPGGSYRHRPAILAAANLGFYNVLHDQLCRG